MPNADMNFVRTAQAIAVICLPFFLVLYDLYKTARFPTDVISFAQLTERPGMAQLVASRMKYEVTILDVARAMEKCSTLQELQAKADGEGGGFFHTARMALWQLAWGLDCTVVPGYADKVHSYTVFVLQQKGCLKPLATDRPPAR